MVNTMNTPITNEEIGHILEEIGQLLEITGETPFKSRAYFNAVHILRELDVPIQTFVEQGTLSSIKGFGKALTQKITELVETGHLNYYEKLKASVPPGLFEIASLPGLDHRKTGILYLKLGIATLDELEQACLQNQIAAVRGFSAAKQQQLLEAIRSQKHARGEFSFES
ncbi:DNA polymerase IV, Family X [Candidatus Vecturithrix granuli]|uniref:DNA polymerase IV, Family X n=1 Tax=Vecturithrix granuli TaxID=1499967 RepID=A0A081C6K3_VECG1|nr:DNA polymerase IV, Family X [Candidatus Vecturithrix granuli]